MNRTWVCFVMLAGMVAMAISAQESVELGVFQASNQDEAGAPVGVRPYELDWADRVEPAQQQQVDFENLAGWRVRCFDGADARLYRSQQEFCFGEYAAKVVYTGSGAVSRFIVEPPKPLPVYAPFTGVNLWVRGNNWSFMDAPAPMRARVAVLIEDASGQRYRIALDSVTFDYWSLMHATMFNPADGTPNACVVPLDGADAVIDYPAKFLGIECIGFSNAKPARLYFDALSLYVMRYPALTFEPPPDTLPWPTTPDTILPTLNEAPQTSSFESQGEGCVWQAEYASGPIRIQYVPSDGTLGDITVEAAGQTFQPCWRGGIVFEVDGKPLRPGDEGVLARCKYTGVQDGAAVADWVLWREEGQPVAYRYEMRLKGKSLVVDVTSEGGQATRLDLGLAKGLDAAKAVYIPYLTYGSDWPRVVCAKGSGGPLFLLSVIDYYNSDASELFGPPQLQDAGAIPYTGGAVYNKKTDGTRNNLRERIFINVGVNVHEVLPNIPNPDCDTGDIARQYIWRNIGAPDQPMLDTCKAYGIDKFIACHHEVGWRDGGESFTMRLRCAPRIGDEELVRYGKYLREVLGYRFGTYTNYVDFAPVNSNWNEDDVCLNSDGTWQTAWPRTYALKPLRAVEKEAYYAPRIHEKFGTNAQYCDVHTAYTPWGRTDYDARTPGAGMFRTQFNAFARLLWNESKAHDGPVFSEGNYHWFYAGIVDGDYATMLPYGRGWQVPPIVDFDLLKMHPKMTDFGMGYGDMFYGHNGTWNSDQSRLNPFFDRFIASTVAFGHIGFLTYEWDFTATLKSYYLMQALQQRYTMIPVSEIRYFDGENLVDTSTALLSDAYLRGQVCVKYDSGLETWCNLSLTSDWSVNVDGQAYLLPPGSFVARKPGDILVSTGFVNGQRYDLVQCADYLYLDSRDAFVRTPVLATRGEVAVKPDGDGAWWVIACPEAEEVSIGLEWLGCASGCRFEATAHAVTGEVVGPCEVRLGLGEVTLMPVAGAVKYRLTARSVDDVTGAAWGCKAGRRRLVRGETLPLTVEVQFPSGTDPATYQLAAGSGTSAFTLKEGTQLVGMTEVTLAVPSDAPEGSRYAFPLQLKGAGGAVVDERWFSVEVVSPFEVTFLTQTLPVLAGKPLAFQVGLISSLAAPIDATLAFASPPDWQVAPTDQTFRLEPGVRQTVTWTLNVPPKPSVDPFTVRILYGDKKLDVARYLLVQPKEWVVTDLTGVPMQTGMASRGQKEVPADPELTGALVLTTIETVANEALTCIYMHPPYKCGVGYSFAAIPVTLPEGAPHLEFSLGFRTGSTTQDGCLFKVLVLTDGQEQEVFSEQYADLNRWQACDVDLSAFAGKPVTLKLITDVGPADDSHSDWACWGAPRITFGRDVFVADIHESAPELPVLPAPEPLAGLRAEDLKSVASAELRFETAGVNLGEYTSYIDFNGIEIGTTPPSGSDTEWQPAAVPLTPEALKALREVSNVVIRNPGRDFMKVRKFCLHFTLQDGRRGSSWVAVGPYCSAQDWLMTEGESVPVGANLPSVRLVIPVE